MTLPKVIHSDAISPFALATKNSDIFVNQSVCDPMEYTVSQPERDTDIV
jgi:hypothetical protein